MKGRITMLCNAVVWLDLELCNWMVLMVESGAGDSDGDFFLVVV